MSNYLHYINGASVEGTSGRFSPVFNPAVGEEIGQVQLATDSEVDAAVQAAQAAYPAWSALAPSRRATVMFKWRELLIQNIDKLAELVSIEHGKVHEDAKGEVLRGIEVVEVATSIPNLLKGEYSSQVATGMDAWAVRQSLGVVAGITPFNFPVMIGLWMAPIAIATGNTFVWKPSERDPSACRLVADLAKQAGLPDGVLNIVQGDKVAVDALLHHPLIKAVSFVGSTPIAKYIYATATANGKRAQALGGAKNHAIVMPDADMDMTVDALIGAGYGAAGERCMAISVAVAVGDEAADELVSRLKPRVENLKIGPWNDKDAEMGPLVNQAAYDRVSGYIDAGAAEGADLVVDGRGFSLQGYEKGHFIGGSLFDNVKTDMSIYKEEIFGPVLCVVRAKSYEEARDLATNHEYGNGAAIFTNNGGAARDFATNVQIGMVGINVPIPVPVAWHSFGGWKSSSFGDHNAYGMEAVKFYTHIKNVMGKWPTGATGAQFNFPQNG